MDRIRSLIMATAFLTLVPFSTMAEEGASLPMVTIRGNDREDSSRLVFDWGKTPLYQTQKTPEGIEIIFSEAAEFGVSTATIDKLSRIKGVRVLSPTRVAIDVVVEDNVSIRPFVAQNRLVLDVTGKSIPKQLQEKKPSTPEEKPNISEPPEQAPIEKKAEPSLVAVPPSDANTVNTIETAAGATPTTEQKKESSLRIRITSTEAVAVTAFERSGYLWIVQDKEGIRIPPQIEGEGKESFGTFEPVPAVGTTIYRIKIPPQKKLVAHGGGLVWTIDVVPAGQDKPKTNATDESAPPPTPVLLPVTPTEGDKQSRHLLWASSDTLRVTDIRDGRVGEKIYVALQKSMKEYAGLSQSFVDVDVLPSIIGLAVVPKSDDIKIALSPRGVEISKPNGMNLSSEKDLMAVKGAKKDVSKESTTDSDNADDITRLYDFSTWQSGTKNNLSNNQRLIMAAMAQQNETKQTESLINLARLMLSFNYAMEATGYLDLAERMVPDLIENPEFLALRAAAETLGLNPKSAFTRYNSPMLLPVGELAYWRAYTLARLDDWQQAAQALPDSVSILASYPDDVRNPLSLTLTEVALRDGNITKAKRILDILQPYRDGMTLPYRSAYDYLSGEYSRQMGKMDEAKSLWSGLTTEGDDLYRARARFALTMLQLQAKEITIDKAIDNLEGLRYAWRGDDLEVSINNTLGHTYLDKGEPIRGLTMMKMARDLNPQSELGKRIDSDMRAEFKNLFTPDKIKKLSPVDAMTAYNEFSDLAPAGADGDAITRQLAERLVDVDLLPRAITILKKQVDSGGTLADVSVPLRLATLQTMDGRPDDALTTLDKLELMVKDAEPSAAIPVQQDIGLLRAKALSMKDKPDDALAALALLPDDEKTLRLKADVAWRGKKWQEAADALEQLIGKQNITLTQPLTEQQADMLLNWAVALYLADNRYVLANVRERFGDYMNATAKAQKFDVVTRPRQAALLADRNTIDSIVDETVIFKDFLKSFKASDVPLVPSSASSAPTPTTASSSSSSLANDVVEAD